MKILFLAPQPFYQDRGTPIAVDLLLRALSERGDEIDVLTYHEGEPRTYPNTRLHRIPALPFIRNIRPGFTLKKLVCDFFLFLKAFGFCVRKKYALIHAVEESAFMALVLKIIFRVPYIYDMDSSMADQVLQKFPWMKPAARVLSFMESQAAKHALLVIPVCPALADLAKQYRAKEIVPLPDVSLLSSIAQSQNGSLRKDYSVHGLLFLYIGNLELYQGIDLMLEAFAQAVRRGLDATLVVIGGQEASIQFYQSKAGLLKIPPGRIVFTGPRKPEYIGSYLEQADVLVSPRTQGNNTPMKIYTYLHSGRPVLATNLETHTQVLNSAIALLKDPDAKSFAQGMLDLAADPKLRDRIGSAGQRFVEENYTYSIFKQRVHEMYEARCA